jgi:hypothetical protein
MKILTDEQIGKILEIFNRSTPYIDMLQGAKAQLDQDKADAEAEKREIFNGLFTPDNLNEYGYYQVSKELVEALKQKYE